MSNYYTEKIKEIFEKNRDKRILVLGTSCTGKSTLINKLGVGVDMDKAIFPLLSKKECEYVCQTPWTKEIGNKMDSLVKSRLRINPGEPLFGTVLIDCDLIVYLHICDKLLKERTELRDVNFSDAKNMQKSIEEEINKTDIEVIVLEIEE